MKWFTPKNMSKIPWLRSYFLMFLRKIINFLSQAPVGNRKSETRRKPTTASGQSVVKTGQKHKNCPLHSDMPGGQTHEIDKKKVRVKLY